MILTKKEPFTKEEMTKLSEAQEQLAALSMDLKRVALASYNHSERVADRFIQESLVKKNEIDPALQRPHVRRLLADLEAMLSQKNTLKLAEDALLYSTLFQNAALSI